MDEETSTVQLQLKVSHEKLQEMPGNQKSKDFECSLCSKTFVSPSTFKIHYNNIHLGLKSKCEYCDKLVTNLGSHKKAMHSMVKDFACSVCHKTFNRSDQLKIHYKRMHEKSKSFSCEKCPKAFASESLLKTHLKRTHSEDKINCEICLKTFKIRNELIQHVRHVHEALFECKPCSTFYKSM